MQESKDFFGRNFVEIYSKRQLWNTYYAVIIAISWSLNISVSSFQVLELVICNSLMTLEYFIPVNAST
jgi:hypothetical protein